jgi:hypothetical protein
MFLFLVERASRMCLYNKLTRCTICSLYCVTTPLHVSDTLVAECVMWRMAIVLILSRLSAGLDEKELRSHAQDIQVLVFK